MKASNKLLAFLLIILGCYTNSRTLIRPDIEIYEGDRFDPICGNEIVWHLHLQDGFNNDTITLIMGSDSICEIKNVKTMPNGCTNVFISRYKKNDEDKIFVKNMPYYNMVMDCPDINKDSVNLKILINHKLYNFKHSLKYYKYYGLNFDSTSRNLSFLKSDKCFVCR